MVFVTFMFYISNWKQNISVTRRTVFYYVKGSCWQNCITFKVVFENYLLFHYFVFEQKVFPDCYGRLFHSNLIFCFNWFISTSIFACNEWFHLFVQIQVLTSFFSIGSILEQFIPIYTSSPGLGLNLQMIPHDSDHWWPAKGLSLSRLETCAMFNWTQR